MYVGGGIFAGCIWKTSKDDLKALFGTVVLAQTVLIKLEGKCQKKKKKGALLLAARSTNK